MLVRLYDGGRHSLTTALLALTVVLPPLLQRFLSLRWGIVLYMYPLGLSSLSLHFDCQLCSQSQQLLLVFPFIKRHFKNVT